MSENILEVKGLTKDYGDFVLDKLTFTVPKGVIMGLIGENGAGKSTTINCILNEISKTDGNIEIFGKDYLSEEIEIKDKIGVVFDENHFPDIFTPNETSVYKGYKQDKIEMRGDRAEMSDFPLYLNTVAGGLDRRDQTIGGFSFVVKIYALPVVEIIG